MLKTPGPALLLLGLLATLPASASAAAMTGLSTSVGLAGALVALLASQRGSPASAATVLGLSVLMLLLAVAFVQLRTPGIRFLPIFARRQLPRPLLARAVPSDDDRALLRQARRQFLDLQAAWDAADHDTLRRLTTDGMFAELAAQLPAAGVASERTHVLALEAHLIARERMGPLELASIEFSGVVRDSSRGSAMPLREVWMLTRSQPGEAWKLARQQALL